MVPRIAHEKKEPMDISNLEARCLNGDGDREAVRKLAVPAWTACACSSSKAVQGLGSSLQRTGDLEAVRKLHVPSACAFAFVASKADILTFGVLSSDLQVKYASSMQSTRRGAGEGVLEVSTDGQLLYRRKLWHASENDVGEASSTSSQSR